MVMESTHGRGQGGVSRVLPYLEGRVTDLLTAGDLGLPIGLKTLPDL